MQSNTKIMRDILGEFGGREKVSAVEGLKIANKYYKALPEDDEDFLDAVEEFIFSDKISVFSIGTQWLKKRESILDMRYIDIYDKWVYEAIHGWGQCDQFCGRLTNPILVRDKSLYDNVLKWSDSQDFDLKRISLVTLIGTSPAAAVDIDKVFYMTDKFKHDEDILIQKAVGWVLKVCYREHPNELVHYLKQNVGELTRTTFRYALEKMPKDLRAELMKL
jgi:3-methyladenine DNA glycosylase AlkD